MDRLIGPADFKPVWKTPSQAQAVDILQTCRSWTDSLVSHLGAKDRSAASPLGDGTWSVNDLLGHLATHEHRALVAMGVRQPTADDRASFATVADFNAHHLARKRGWSARRLNDDYRRTRDELVAAIGSLSEERWFAKVPHGSGRSALALVLAKMLNGDKFGYFAHDFAHSRGLEEVVQRTRPPST